MKPTAKQTNDTAFATTPHMSTQRKVTELASQLMRIKAIQSEMVIGIPKEFTHHWTKSLQSITEPKHVELKTEKTLDLMMDFREHLLHFEKDYQASLRSKKEFIEAKEEFQSSLSQNDLNEYWRKRMALFYYTSRAIHQGTMALQCMMVANRRMTDSQSSADCFGPLQTCIAALEDQIAKLNTFVSDKALSPVNIELYPAGHHAAHSQSLKDFINKLDTWVFNSQYKTTFWTKDRVVLQVDPELMKRRKEQVSYLKGIAKTAIDDDCIIDAMRQVAESIEAEGKISRLHDVLQDKIKEYQSYIAGESVSCHI